MITEEKVFSDILKDTIEDNEISSYRNFERLLSEKGITDIKFRRIAEYCNGYTVPSFEKAKNMLNVLDYEISDEDLTSLLSKSREKAKEVKANFGYIQKGKIQKSVFLTYKNLISGFEIDEAESILNDRIEELFGDKTRFSAYVNSLIRKDLKEYLLTKEDVEREN